MDHSAAEKGFNHLGLGLTTKDWTAILLSSAIQISPPLNPQNPIDFRKITVKSRRHHQGVPRPGVPTGPQRSPAVSEVEPLRGAGLGGPSHLRCPGGQEVSGRDAGGSAPVAQRLNGVVGPSWIIYRSSMVNLWVIYGSSIDHLCSMITNLVGDWNMTGLLFRILGISSSQLTNSYFVREVAQPPTSHKWSKNDVGIPY